MILICINNKFDNIDINNLKDHHGFKHPIGEFDLFKIGKKYELRFEGFIKSRYAYYSVRKNRKYISWIYGNEINKHFSTLNKIRESKINEIIK